MPSKLGAHAFHSNLYLYKFYEPIQFFDHTNYMYSKAGLYLQLIYTILYYNHYTISIIIAIIIINKTASVITEFIMLEVFS